MPKLGLFEGNDIEFVSHDKQAEVRGNTEILTAGPREELLSHRPMTLVASLSHGLMFLFLPTFISKETR